MSSKPFSNSEKSGFGTMAFSTEKVVTALNLSSVVGGLHKLSFEKLLSQLVMDNFHVLGHINVTAKLLETYRDIT
jgi:hypothetical protein